MKLTIKGRAHWINFHHLYCFYVIASEGGIAPASKQLAIGSSALSIQLRQFEESLETKLFSRSHRRLELNEHGKIVFAYAQNIFRMGEEMVQALGDRPRDSAVHLQIGALDGVPKHLTVGMVEFILDELPCTVTVIEGKPSSLTKELLNHRIDLFVTNVVPKTAPGLIVTKRIARLPLWVVGGKSFVSRKRDFPHSLRGAPFILPTGDSYVRQVIEDYFAQTQVEPEVIIESQDVITQKMLAIRNVGMTIVPEFAVREYVERRELYLIGKLEESYSENLYLVSARRSIENPAAGILFRKFKIR